MRNLLVQFEAETIEDYYKLELSENKKRAIVEHLRQLLEYFLIEGVKIETHSGTTAKVFFIAPRLTSAGHELLETMRSVDSREIV